MRRSFNTNLHNASSPRGATFNSQQQHASNSSGRDGSGLSGFGTGNSAASGADLYEEGSALREDLLKYSQHVDA